MRKTLIIALREYLAAVKAKSFIISLILLPIMMSGGFIATRLGEKMSDTSAKHVAIIDHTADAALFDSLSKAVVQYNRASVDSSGKAFRSPFVLEKTAPATADQGDQQRLDLSNRVRSGELLAFVEIGADILQPSTQPTTLRSDSDTDDRTSIQYSSNRPTYRDFLSLLESSVPPAVREKRLAAAGMSYQQLRPMLDVPRVENRGLAEQSEGKIGYASKTGQLAPFILPFAMIFLMYIVVIVGASPMTANVIEEKQLRIAEVLLGSVRPFELMMGKLLGGVAVALTLAAIYCSGAYYLATVSGMASYLAGSAVLWFVLFTILATLMYGSMFVAAGSAVTNLKEAQSMMMPVMMLVVLPMFLIGPMIQDPGGKLATIGSMFPFSAPMVMTARVAIPPGVPVWQILVAVVSTLLTTTFIIWAAGRIFRVGILMQGQGARIPDLLRWVLRG